MNENKIFKLNLKARLADIKHVGKGYDIRAGGQEVLSDISKRVNNLGYEPKYNFKEVIRHTIDWYVNNL